MSERLPPLPSGLIIRQVEGGEVEVECPGCGEKDDLPPSPEVDFLRDAQACMSRHAGCWQSDDSTGTACPA